MSFSRCLNLSTLIAVCFAACFFFSIQSYANDNQPTIIIVENEKRHYEVGEHIKFIIGVRSTDGSYLTKAWCGFGYNRSTMRLLSETDSPDHVWAVSGKPSRWLYRELEFELTADGKCYFIAGAHSGKGVIQAYRADGSRTELPRASVVYPVGSGLYSGTSDCDLMSLDVTDAMNGAVVRLDRTFDPHITDYSCDASPDLERISIMAQAADKSDTVTVPDDIVLDSGMNDIPVTVTSPDGKQRVYTVHINKADIPAVCSNIILKDGSGNVIKYDFSPDNTEYEIKVPMSAAELSFEAVSPGKDCTVTYPAITEVTPGYNIYYVTITSPSETKKYEYYVYRELSALSLSSLVLEGSDDEVLEFDHPFQPDRLLYNASVPADVRSVKVTYTLGNPGDKVLEEEEERSLVNGMNYLTVTVTDGTNKREYTVKVDRAEYAQVANSEDAPKRNDRDFSIYHMINLLPLAIIGILVLVGIVAVSAVHLKRAGGDYFGSAENASDLAEMQRKKRLKEIEKRRKQERKDRER